MKIKGKREEGENEVAEEIKNEFSNFYPNIIHLDI